MGAKVRDINVCLLGGIQYRRSLGHGDFNFING